LLDVIKSAKMDQKQSILISLTVILMTS